MPYTPIVGGYKWLDRLDLLESNLDEIVTYLRPLSQAAKNEATLRRIYRSLELCYENRAIVAELRKFREPNDG